MTEVSSYKTRRYISAAISIIFGVLYLLATLSNSFERMLLFIIPWMIFLWIAIYYGRKVEQIKQGN